MAISHHNDNISASDIRANGWVATLPVSLRALALLSRLDRPIGLWLLFFPASWGLIVAYHGVPPLLMLVKYFIGAVAMRGAGCTINDILDRNLDGAVARTTARPLPAGMISVLAAWLWLAVQLLVAAFILFALPQTVWLWGVAALPLVLLYPLMKRLTWWPQLWLGMTFNWGLFLGAAGAGAMPDKGTLFLYLGAILWTLGYDTIYAAQDIEDDARIGVKSTARLLGEFAHMAVALFYDIAWILWMVAGFIAGLHWTYYIAVGGTVILMARQFFVWKKGDRDSARAAFISNQWVGLMLALSLLAGYVAA